MKEDSFKVSTDYKDILKSMATFLYARKKSLAYRVLLLTWPFFILAFSFPVFETVNKVKQLPFDIKSFALFVTFFGGAFCVSYIFAMRLLFFVEKIIWIDSFFDKKPLSDKESFRIARKIFISSIKMRIALFFNYYIFGFIFYLGGTPLLFYLAVKLESEVVSTVAVGMLLFGLVPVWFYFYYLDIKLRYFWMIFLDKYNKDNLSYLEIKREMFKLNEVSKGNAYKKIIIMNFGVESTKLITQGVINLLMSFLEQFVAKVGPYGGALAGSVKFYLEEYLNQTAEIGKLFTKYVLYRHARSVLYKDKQIINSKLYSLKNKTL